MLCMLVCVLVVKWCRFNPLAIDTIIVALAFYSMLLTHKFLHLLLHDRITYSVVVNAELFVIHSTTMMFNNYI